MSIEKVKGPLRIMYTLECARLPSIGHLARMWIYLTVLTHRQDDKT